MPAKGREAMNLLDDLIRRTGTFCRWGVLLTGVFYVLVSFSVAWRREGARMDRAAKTGFR